MRRIAVAISIVVLTAELRASNDQTPRRAAPRIRMVPVEGIVVDEKGRPAQDIEVCVFFSRPRSAVRTGKDGRFALQVPFYLAKRPPLLARTSEGDRQTFSWKVRDERSPAHVRLALGPARTISTLVLDRKGTPVPQAQVAVDLQNYAIAAAEQTTGADGKATLLLPLEMPLGTISAVKDEVGLDYFVYQGTGDRGITANKLSTNGPQPITFRLLGARTMQIRLFDEATNKPVPGIQVRARAFRLANKGGSFYPRSMEFSKTSDQSGFVTFRTIPNELQNPFQFSVDGPNYSAPPLKWDPKRSSNKTSILMKRVSYDLLPGSVRYPDGKPGAEARLHIVTSGGGGTSNFHVYWDSDGKFETRTAPNLYALFFAAKGHDVSNVASRVILKGRAVEPVDLVLEPGTRLYGVFTAGKQRRPVASATVYLVNPDPGNYAKLPDAQKLAPSTGPNSPQLNLVHPARTDAQGAFEFFVPPGRYYFTGTLPGVVTGADGRIPDPIDIKSHKSVEINLHKDSL
jgi:hypothetical protein